jgi:ABC-type ATPase with predicted acetyltransferase domain
MKCAFLLWHRDEPIGICVFIAPPKALAQRHRFFGQSGRWNRTTLRTLNRQMLTLSRVVIHPTYRGAGLAHLFIRRCCEQCPVPWIETLTQLGQFHPVFERAGFVNLGTSQRPVKPSRQAHSVLYRRKQKRGRRLLLTEETSEKSRFSNPVYFLFDNRAQTENTSD